jgi:hypothetical protein
MDPEFLTLSIEPLLTADIKIILDACQRLPL